MAPANRRRKLRPQPVASTEPVRVVDKDRIHNTFGQILTDAQTVTQPGALLKKVKELYYFVKVDSGAAVAHQKKCAAEIWKFMFAIFNSHKGECKDNAMEFFTKMLTCLGLEDDVKDSGFPFQNIPPFFVFILKCINQCHSDIRSQIRCHTMEVAKTILENFSNHPYLNHHKSINTKTCETLCHRVRDKHPSVRIPALHCLGFYTSDPQTQYIMSFSAKKDPNAEVRLTALKILGSMQGIKTSVFYGQAFDSSELVRQEAFRRLAQIPLQKLNNVEHRRKLISWGLSQSRAVRNIVEKKMLPAWLAYSDHSLINLLIKLELATKAHIVTLILDIFYKENDEETLRQVDLSFLSEKKLIPVDELNVEKVQYWLMLCVKFQNVGACSDILLPDALDLCSYILEVVAAIHKECETARAEERDEEYTLFLCLALIFRISEFLTLEEGSRREMQGVVKQILFDPVLEDCIIVNACMDVTFKVIPRNEFEDFMSEVFASIFKEAYTCANIDDPLSEATNNLSIKGPEGGDQNNVSNGPPCPEAEMNRGDSIDTNGISMTGSSPGRNTSMMGRRVAFKPLFGTSSPSPGVPKSVQEAVYTLEELRRKKADVTLMKIRMQNLLDQENAKPVENRKTKDLENIKRNLEILKNEEKDLIAKFDSALSAQEVGFITAHGTVAPVQRNISPERDIIVENSSPEITPVSSPRATPEPESMDIDDLNDRNCMLKGLAILLRYLIWYRRVSPTLQMMFDFSIVPCLEDEDSRIRAKVMNIMGIIATLKPEHARSTMLLMYKGVVFEEDTIAKSAAYRSLLDLLLEYDPMMFKPSEFLCDDSFRGLPFAEPLNNPESTREELRDAFTSFVVSYGGDTPTVNELTLRVHGVIKLMLRGRITSVDVLADLYNLWMNPCYAISTVCHQIASFLPFYASLSLANSRRVAKAYVISLRRAFQERDANVESFGNKEVDFQGLTDFILTCLSPENLAKIPNYQVIHEELGLDILREISVDATTKANTQFARILHSLKIETKESALKIFNMCTTVFQAMVPVLNVAHTNNTAKAGVSSLRTALTTMLDKLVNNFELNAPGTSSENLASEIVETESEDEEPEPDVLDSTCPISQHLSRRDSTAFEI